MKPVSILLSLTLCICLFGNCVNSSSQKTPAITEGDSLNVGKTTMAPAGLPVTGADQVSEYLDYLKGKKIGILVNQTSIIGKTPEVSPSTCKAAFNSPFTASLSETLSVLVKDIVVGPAVLITPSTTR